VTGGADVQPLYFKAHIVVRAHPYISPISALPAPHCDWRTQVKNLIAAAMAAAALMPLLPAGRANADDDSYIATLDAMGVPYRNRAAAIQFGQVICKALKGGTSVATLVDMTTSDGVYSRVQANSLIGAAQGGLCPEVNVPPN
jgi:Protein of unknown function (DUF732)